MNSRTLYCCVLAGTFLAFRPPALGAGVTLITHGLNGNVDDWILPMAEKIPAHPAFPGSTFSCYEIFFVSTGNGFRVANEWIGGVAPQDSDSGEILIKLDWRQLANNDYSTYEVAAMVVPRLLEPGFIAELDGRALAEWPLHLIGHSRGGSLVCEMSRLLGNQGVWVDHVTTLDPHPLNNDGFMDGPFYTVVDATAVTYENVLFADNYFQRIDFLIYGKDVPGAYVRELTSLDGGYGGIFGGAHSDVHLWYHGTLDLATPTTDTGASLGTSQRSAWWTAFEARGTNAGFHYSRIGGGDRLSPAQPVPTRARRIVDGLNQRWDFGAGVADNRATLDFNNGQWPNLIELKVSGATQISAGQSLTIQSFFQYGQGPGENAELRLFLDVDRNPLNPNAAEIGRFTLAATGLDQVASVISEVPLPAEGLPPGDYAVAGWVSDGSQSRWLYAAPSFTVMPPARAPTLAVVGWTENGFAIRVDAEQERTVIVQASSDFGVWVSLATNVVPTSGWIYTDETAAAAGGAARRFYRVRIP